MGGAEEGWFGIHPVGTNDDRRRIASGTRPVERGVAGEDADGGPQRGSFSNAQELPAKRRRRAEVVVVVERAGSGQGGDGRPLADLMPPDAERDGAAPNSS